MIAGFVYAMSLNCDRTHLGYLAVGRQTGNLSGFRRKINLHTALPSLGSWMPGDPRSGSKVWEAPDREIGKPGENRGKIAAHRNFQPAAAFHD
jgi:hypothetical protein